MPPPNPPPVPRFMYECVYWAYEWTWIYHFAARKSVKKNGAQHDAIGPARFDADHYRYPFCSRLLINTL